MTLGVVVAYFNPFGDVLRKQLTLDFLKYISQFDVIVQVVEVRHKVSAIETTDDHWLFARNIKYANMLLPIRLVADTILWRKENLINIGERNLPSSVDTIAWMDSDLFYIGSQWPTQVKEALEKYDIVQMFEKVNILDNLGKISESVYSVVRMQSASIYSDKVHMYPGHPGFAWAARRDVFKRIGGLCEYAIVGGGDEDMVYLYSLFEGIDESNINRSTKHYEELRGLRQEINWEHLNIGYVPISVYHRWHGDLSTRGYDTRQKILIDGNYDPLVDTTKDSNGLITLSSEGQRFRDPLISYFKSRIQTV